MHHIYRASEEFAPEIVGIINSNAPLYRPLIPEGACSDEIDVDLQWAESVFANREVYILKTTDPQTGAEGWLGFATYQNLQKFSYIGYLYVRYGHHQRGIGQALLNYLEFKTALDKLPEIRLFVHRKAHWAGKFYTHAGYTVLASEKEEILAMDGGIMQPFFVDDHIYMHKLISRG